MRGDHPIHRSFLVGRGGSLLLVLSVCATLGANGRWHAFEGGRHLELAVPAQGRPGFTLLAPLETGVGFTNRVDDLASAANRVLENGSGVAAGDYDRDGLPDLFFCSLEGSNTLYRNLGNWRFEDATSRAGLCQSRFIGRGATFADLNGDGWPDLLASTLAEGVRCFLNDTRGGFQDFTAGAGTGSRLGATTLALADVDGNGTLDLYVATYRAEDARDNALIEVQVVDGRMALHPKYQGRLFLTPQGLFEYGDPDLLYLNDGKGRFREVSWTAGVFLDDEGRALGGAPLDWGLTASFRDLNHDGWPDLYVCNDYWTPDRLWFNDGQGRFRSADPLALRHTSENSMGVDFADLDRDGHVDFLVLDMLSRDPQMRRRQVLAQTKIPREPGEIASRPQIMRNTLFHSRGDQTFAEIADYAGLQASEWSWQPVFLDVDLDGHEDLLIPAGHRRDVQDLDATAKIRALQHPWPRDMDRQQRQAQFTREMMEHGRLYPPLEMPVLAFRNRGDLRFEEVTAAWGTEASGVHQGIALADFDLDGDLDFAVNRLDGPAGLYRNDGVAPRVAVRLNGRSSNTQGIGSKVTLTGGPVPRQTQEVICGGRYLSGSQPLLVFAAAHGEGALSLEVRWRSGRTSQIAGVRVNHLYEFEEPPLETGPAAVAGPQRPRVTGTSTLERGERGPPPAGLFEDVSDRVRHRHHDERFDDFGRQPLLPRQLSQLGPGVAWFDLNGDGWEDLIVGGGKGGQPAVFRNDGKGGFAPAGESILTSTLEQDQTGVLGWDAAPGQAVILMGTANYENDSARGPALRQFDLQANRVGELASEHESSTGPLAMADYDGDGDLDLFVGGRCLGGRYPQAASSLLLRRTDGEWIPDEEHCRMLQGVGLVSGAVWSDLDADGWPELLLACEWGPLRVFRNRKGMIEETNFPLTWPAARQQPHPTPSSQFVGSIRELTGWWTAVTTGDLDGDGRLDIVAANWGLNTPYRAAVKDPVVLYHGDFMDRGTVDLIETEFDARRGVVAPRHRLDYLAAGLPVLSARFPSFRAFSEATLEQVFEALGPPAGKVEATTLSTLALYNRGDHFEAVELPREAQWAPAFGCVVADFDGDGREDVWLSQNFFALPWELHRLDAGRGLMLLGTGDGTLRPMPGQESGIRVYGEQRGAAACDFDHDGRVDLVVTQNAAETKLYRNAGAAPGLRIRLAGPPGNPAGVGAILQSTSTGRRGPAREIHAGSGYWSQDASTRVLGAEVSGVRVQWPGGRVTSHLISNDAAEVLLGHDGASHVVRTR